jgi:peptide/nickel transport system substrate-binding protein
LITLAPGDYQTLRPLLAESWERTPDGKGFRFKLRKDVKFVSGAPMTADDVKFSFDRLVNVKDQPSAYADNLGRVDVVDPYTVDVFPTSMDLPLLTILTAPSCGIYEKKIALANGATADADAKTTDKAAQWFGTTSIGTGPYKLVTWERNVQVTMVRNPNYWNGTPGFERVIIRHIGDGGARLLALKRGDIDVAFNLSPEQLASVSDSADLAIAAEPTFDYVYGDYQLPELNPVLAKKKRASDRVCDRLRRHPRRAVRRVGAAGVVHPYGIGGSSKEFVQQARYSLNPAKARRCWRRRACPMVSSSRWPGTRPSPARRFRSSRKRSSRISPR